MTEILSVIFWTTCEVEERNAKSHEEHFVDPNIIYINDEVYIGFNYLLVFIE